MSDGEPAFKQVTIRFGKEDPWSINVPSNLTFDKLLNFACHHYEVEPDDYILQDGKAGRLSFF